MGSCTNGRIEDIRAVAAVVKGKKVHIVFCMVCVRAHVCVDVYKRALHTKVHKDVYAMVVPGSGLVKEQAVREGLDKILIEAGIDWREPGCSMCLVRTDMHRTCLYVSMCVCHGPFTCTHVHAGHEPGQAGARRAVRLDIKPQLRGPPGQRRTHAPHVAADGRRRRHHWHPDGHSRVWPSGHRDA